MGDADFSDMLARHRAGMNRSADESAAQVRLQREIAAAIVRDEDEFADCVARQLREPRVAA